MNQLLQMDRWQQLDEPTAEAYERYLVPLLFAPGAEFLVELAAPQPGDRLLDAATGTGSVARSAARRVGATAKVTGLDVSESMLKVARKVSPEIEWKRGDVHNIPFADATFDIVLCQQGLQFFTHQHAALHEMHRVLAPDGRLALSVLRPIEHNPGWKLMAEVLERHAGFEAGMLMRSPFPELRGADLRQLVTDAGFTDVRLILGIGPVRYPSAAEFFQWETSSWLLAQPLKSLTEDMRDALIDDLDDALQIYTDDLGIVFPAETYLVSARRS